MANILVLGGSGFVSSSLSKHLINRGYDIDILTRGIKTIDYQGYNKHLLCNRRNVSELKSILKNKFYSYIFDISAYTKNDIEILFESIEDISSIKRYIFCSSAAVYSNNGSPVNEGSTTISDSAWGDYGYNKIEAENYIFNMINKSGLKATIFRPTYIYGKGNNLYRESYFFSR